jgi:hypothetical protein
LEAATLEPSQNSERTFWATEEVGMALPKIVLRGRKIILLSGFKDEAWDKSTQRRKVVVDAEDKLRRAAKANPDAVAFGYVAGEWVASA